MTATADQIFIRIDGIVLGLAMIAGIVIFAIYALVAALITLIQPDDRRHWQTTYLATLCCITNLLALAGMQCFKDKLIDLTQPDWLDPLAVPWVGLVLLALISLVQAGKKQR